MKKTAASLFLTLSLSLGLLVGCGGQQGGTSQQPPAPVQSAPSGSGSSQPEPAQPAAPSGEAAKPDGYPSKTINFIVPAAAGASIDLPTRALVDMLDLGATVVVENIAGASQTLGAAEAATRDADGYTLLVGANNWALIQPNMNDVLYNVDDFRHIAMMTGLVHDVIVVKADSEYQTIQDLLDHIKAEKFVYGIPTPGGHGHLALTSMLQQLNIYDNGSCVTYSNANEEISALLAGAVEFGVLDSDAAAQRMEAGDLRPLALLSDESCEYLEGVPNVTEYGITDIGGFKGLKWVAVRKDTPDEIVEWLKQEMNKVIQSDQYQQYLEDNMLGRVEEWSEEDLTAYIQNASQAYHDVLSSLGMAK